MANCRIIILILAFLPFVIVTPNDKEFHFIMPDTNSFSGEIYNLTRVSSSSLLHELIEDSYSDSSLLLYGYLKNRDFLIYNGFFKYDTNNVQPLYVKLTNGANDTTYINLLPYSISQSETHTNTFYCLNECKFEGHDIKEIARYKQYDNNDHRWTIYRKSIDEDEIWGRSYSSRKEYLFDVEEDYLIKKISWKIIFIFMVFLFLCILFRPLINNKINYKLMIVFCGVAIYLSFVVVEYIQHQVLLPLISLASFIFIYVKIKLKRKIVEICLYYMLCFVIIGFWINLLVFSLHEHIILSDGLKIELHWRPGTSLFQRFIIKRIITNLRPVPVKDHGKNYKVFVSKYEFTKGEMYGLNEDIFGLLHYIMYDFALRSFSYREAQVLLQMINNRSGVNFDFLSYQEWQSASLNKNHAPHLDKPYLNSVEEGDENIYGLVNISNNVSEFTSNYTRFAKLGLAADTIFFAYSNVTVAGNAYASDDSINYSIVNKNLREGSVGFRLVYRPNNIGARRFYIKGTLRSDRAFTKLPKEIKLISIDEHDISELDNYESFEELLIECRFKNYSVQAKDMSTMKNFHFNQAKGFEYYDYEPIFSFIGVDE